MKKRHLITLTIILVAGIGAYWAGLGTRGPAPVSPVKTDHFIDGLAVELASSDLGEVWKEKEVIRQMRISNENAEDVVIERFELGCSSCTSIEPKSLRIAAGETAIIDLNFVPR